MSFSPSGIAGEWVENQGGRAVGDGMGSTIQALFSSPPKNFHLSYQMFVLRILPSRLGFSSNRQALSARTTRSPSTTRTLCAPALCARPHLACATAP